MQRFAGRTAVVTGGADGIGLAMAHALAGVGMRMALLDIRTEAAEAAAAELRGAGGDAIGIGCDISDADSLASAAAAVAGRFGSIALLVANAGVGAAGGLLSASDANLAWVLSVNIHGTIATARQFVPLFDTADAGPRHLLVTASAASLVPVQGPGLALYAAAKHCTMGIAEGLAAELEPQGIGTTILCPGLINTRIWDGARARPDRFGGARHADEAVGEHWRANGLPAAWVAEAALAAIAAGDRYCAPVEPHIRTLHDDRAAAIRAGMIFPSVS